MSKSNYLILFIKVSLSLVLFVTAPQLYAQENQNEWILSVNMSDKTILSQGILAKEIENNWLFNIEELGEILQFKVAIKKETILASFSEKNFELPHFQKNSDEGIYYIGLDTFNQTFNCNAFVEKNLSMFIVDCANDFPAQAKIKRSRNRSLGDDVNTKEIELIQSEKNTISGPFVDFNLSSQYIKSEDRLINNATVATAWGTPEESLATFHNFNENSNNNRFTYYNIKDDNSLYTEIMALDIYTQALPLVRNSSLGKGLNVTNITQYKSNVYSRRTFSGEIPFGWEVELYRNNNLLQVTESKEGRYIFQDIPLYYGPNNFVLKFIGPYGEIKQEEINFDLSSNIEKKLTYNLSLRKDEKQLNLEQDNYISKTIDIQSPLNDFTFIRLFYEDFQDEEKFYGTGVSFLTDIGNLNITNVISNNENAQLYEFSTRISNSSINLSHANLNNFSSPFYRLLDSRQITSQTDFLYSQFFENLPISIQGSFHSQTFENSDQNQDLSLFTAYQHSNQIFELGNIYESNTNLLNYKLGHIYAKNRIRTRTEITWNKQRVQELSSSINFINSPSSLTRLKVQNTPLNHLTTYLLSYSKDFKTFGLFSSVEMNNESDYTVTGRINFGFQRDDINNNLHFYSQAVTNKGAIIIQTFKDQNYNGLKDNDEPFLSGVEINIKNASGKTKTDSQGYAYIGNLPLHWPLELTIDLASIEDPNLFPAKKFINFICQRGNTMKFSYPIVLLGDTDIFIDYIGEKNDIYYLLRKINISLYDKNNQLIKQSTVDEDGMVYFSQLPLGEYTAIIKSTDQDLLNKLNYKEIKIKISEQNLYQINTLSLLDL